VAIIKHANPCGIAVGADAAEAHRKAHACDPVSAFGGVIATNVTVSVAMAEQVAEVFTEVVLAPGFEDGAVELLSRKPSIRLLVVPPSPPQGVEWRPISGGMLLQVRDRLDAPGDDPAAWSLQTGEASAEVLDDLAFAWRAVRAVKSNAILLASGGATVGVGMGQVNRVDAARLAVERAGDRAGERSPPRTRSSPSPTGCRCCSTPGFAPSCNPAGRSATPKWSPLRKP
jgi:phosphoribosylaminoimidazolecarboxamide formyltransferase/IMP cyclohydrolase